MTFEPVTLEDALIMVAVLVVAIGLNVWSSYALAETIAKYWSRRD
jgi:hypothetical protein